MGNSAPSTLARVLHDEERKTMSTLTGEAPCRPGHAVWAKLAAFTTPLQHIPPQDLSLVTRNFCDRMGECLVCGFRPWDGPRPPLMPNKGTRCARFVEGRLLSVAPALRIRGATRPRYPADGVLCGSVLGWSDRGASLTSISSNLAAPLLRSPCRVGCHPV